MSRGTSFDELYSTIGAVLNGATGRKWWRKPKIQGQPKEPYATVFLSSGTGLQVPVTEVVPIDPPDKDGHSFQEGPWGTLLIECQVECFRDRANASALQDTNRFINSLRLTEREWDLWQICGLSGGVNLIDISGMFRADIEPRARATFRFYANVADAPLSDTKIYDIQTLPIIITTSDGSRNQFAVTNTGEIVPWPTT